MKFQLALLALPLLAIADPYAAPDAVADPTALADPTPEEATLERREALAEALADGEEEARIAAADEGAERNAPPPPAPTLRAAAKTVQQTGQTCKVTIKKGSLSCWSCPARCCKAVKPNFYKPGSKANLSCWTLGQKIKGNSYWDKTTDGCYISEYYVDKKCAYKLPRCPS